MSKFINVNWIDCVFHHHPHLKGTAKKQQRPGSTPANNVKKISFGRTFWRLWNVEQNGYSFRTKDCPTWSPNLARYGPFKLSNSFNETNCYRDLFPLFHSFTVSVLLTTYCIYYLLYFLGFHMQFCRQVEHFRPHNSILLYYELGMTWFSNIMPVPLSLSLSRGLCYSWLFSTTRYCVFWAYVICQCTNIMCNLAKLSKQKAKQQLSLFASMRKWLWHLLQPRFQAVGFALLNLKL